LEHRDHITEARGEKENRRHRVNPFYFISSSAVLARRAAVYATQRTAGPKEPTLFPAFNRGIPPCPSAISSSAAADDLKPTQEIWLFHPVWQCSKTENEIQERCLPETRDLSQTRYICKPKPKPNTIPKPKKLYFTPYTLLQRPEAKPNKN
jgi:hypothetical protein